MIAMFACENKPARLVLAFGLAVLTVPLASGAGVAQEQEGLMDEEALGILNQMSEYLGDAKTMSFDTKSFIDVASEFGINIKSGRQSSVYLKRPEGLYINTLGDDGSDSAFWFNGATLTFWQRHANQVMSLEFNGTTDAMLDHLIDEFDIEIPMADLFYENLYDTFVENITSAEYIGIRIAGGVKCHQLSFESVGSEWQIWIEADNTPVPRRFVINFIDEESRPQYMAQIDNWSIDGEIEDFYFSIVVPEDVERLEFQKP